MTAKTKAAVANPTDAIAELVECRDHLLELKGLTEMAPRALVEAEADVAQTVAMLASQCEPQVAWLAQGPTGYADLARQLSQRDEGCAQIPPASLLAWMLPTELGAALKRDLALAYQELPSPMPASAKAKELARLQTEIGQVESELATVWWSAVDAGLSLPPPPVSGAVLIGLSDS